MNHMADKHPTCVDCAMNTCRKNGAEYPAFCPTRDFDLQEQHELQQLMEEEQTRRIYVSAAHSAHIGFTQEIDRLQETILFAQGYGAKKIGIASCVSYAKEARYAAKVLRKAGFEVVGVICKIGSLTCEQMDVPLEARSPETALCNPVYQAMTLNAEQTDLNVVIGLCVGHDSLFFKHSDAPCTALVAKDFKHGHGVAPSLQEG